MNRQSGVFQGWKGIFLLMKVLFNLTVIQCIKPLFRFCRLKVSIWIREYLFNIGSKWVAQFCLH